MLKEWLNHVVQEVYLLPWLFYNPIAPKALYPKLHKGCYHLNDTLFAKRDFRSHTNYTNSYYAPYPEEFMENYLTNHAFIWISNNSVVLTTKPQAVQSI